MRVVLIHGWNVKDGGKGTVDTLAPYFEELGWEVDSDEADYGFIFWRMLSIIGRWLFTKKIIKRLIPAVQKADMIVTHSNGANFATRAMKQLNNLYDGTKIVVHISPALNRKTEPPRAVKAQLVIHTRKDSAVKAARWLIFSPWGSMGAWGYQGYDERVDNADFTNIASGHSAHFKKPDKRKIVATTCDDYYRRKD
jgi:hypothetical protein